MTDTHTHTHTDRQTDRQTEWLGENHNTFFKGIEMESEMGNRITAMEKFTYVGCTISSDAHVDKELDNRLGNRAFERLYKRVRKNQNLRSSTKTSVYRAIVLTTLLYSAETCVTYQAHIKLLECFHQRCLCTILGIHWSDYVSNQEVLDKAGISSIEAMVVQQQLRWAGHVSRWNKIAYQRGLYMAN